MRIRSLLLSSVALTAMAFAQQTVKVETDVVTNVQTDIQTNVQANVKHFASADSVGMMGGPMGGVAMRITLHTVKGAPYAAEATQESVQTLADGNKIVNKSTTKMYRDSEGRTRMEITPSQLGAWMPGDKAFSTTLIDDPVTGEHVNLNNSRKTATKLSVKRIQGDAAPGKPMETHVTIRSQHGPGPGPMVQDERVMQFKHLEAGQGMPGAADVMKPAGATTKSESLGKRTIEGVEATGTRETMTLAAGAIGNERPIDVVTETWTSAELGFDLLRTTDDPRFGQTTYKIANLVRAEQPKSLFEIPADYKLEEGSYNMQVIHSESKTK